MRPSIKPSQNGGTSMTRALLDTNALIDLVINRYPDRHRAMIEICSLMEEETGDCLIAPTLSIKDLSYFIESSKHAQEAIPNRKERMSRSALARTFILDNCVIAPIDERVARMAHANESEPDYDDALIAECARANDADVILSSDNRAFRESYIPKMSPQELVRHLRVQRHERKI